MARELKRNHIDMQPGDIIVMLVDVLGDEIDVMTHGMKRRLG